MVTGCSAAELRSSRFAPMPSSLKDKASRILPGRGVGVGVIVGVGVMVGVGVGVGVAGFIHAHDFVGLFGS